MRIAFACVGLLFCGSQAEATCRTGSFSFRLGNETPIAATTSYTHGGDQCLLGFRGGIRTKYESINVTRAPSNGSTRVHSSGYGIIYTANSSFKGIDTLQVRLCGHGGARRGCAVFNYTVSVR